jgi:hypothetical protein
MPLEPPDIPFEHVLGCGYLAADGEGQWHSKSQGPDPSVGLATLKIGSETFKVVRMYRLKLHRLRLTTPSGVLFVATANEVTVALLLGEATQSPSALADVWLWLETWLRQLRTSSLAPAATGARLG